jgi:hypothetical protein
MTQEVVLQSEYIDESFSKKGDITKRRIRKRIVYSFANRIRDETNLSFANLKVPQIIEILWPWFELAIDLNAKEIYGFDRRKFGRYIRSHFSYDRFKDMQYLNIFSLSKEKFNAVYPHYDEITRTQSYRTLLASSKNSSKIFDN